MDLIADESLTGDIVQALRKQGHNVFYIAESHSGIADEEVLSKALERNEVLLTEDKDFGDLVHARASEHAGVVLFRLDGLPLHEKVARAIMALSTHATKLRGNFLVVEPNRIRLREQ